MASPPSSGSLDAPVKVSGCPYQAERVIKTLHGSVLPDDRGDIRNLCYELAPSGSLTARYVGVYVVVNGVVRNYTMEQKSSTHHVTHLSNTKSLKESITKLKKKDEMMVTNNNNDGINKEVEVGGEGNSRRRKTRQDIARNLFSARFPHAYVLVHLYSKGRGPISIFESYLDGQKQNRLRVPDILKEYGFKKIFVFNPRECTRGAQIRFNPLTGWSHHSYSDGSDFHIDGEPKGARGRIKAPLTKSQEKFGSSSKLF
ncbi:hypothetical protein Tsubulata_013724 [Turnera subulata]|uniref:Uncharacterized protein n=1 Tax=Turnera subulata TaxID=218843 RepID=A0A9Q0JC74_9ROSI|nr:hypothetical protein Tsubulata_013724 [Turnera subulata]